MLSILKFLLLVFLISFLIRMVARAFWISRATKEYKNYQEAQRKAQSENQYGRRPFFGSEEKDISSEAKIIEDKDENR